LKDKNDESAQKNVHDCTVFCAKYIGLCLSSSFIGSKKYIPIQFDSKIAILYYFRIIFRLVAVNWSKIRGSSKF